MEFSKYRFSRKLNTDFATELKGRVNEYFSKNKISKHGDYSMVIKSIVLFIIYLGPYFLMLFTGIESIPVIIAMYAVMGSGKAFIGLSVMHDANHGTFSKNRKFNDFVSKSMWLIGGSPTTWQLQHNVLHHTYTNVKGIDEDIDSTFLLRLSPHHPRLKVHKYQHLYAWFLYSLMTFLWITTHDFQQLSRYKKYGLIKDKKEYKSHLFKVISWKLFYYFYLLAIPLFFLNAPVLAIIAGFLTMHFVSGFILATIFQSAHVVPESKFPIPDEKNKIESNWLIHQLNTTSNFSQKSGWFTWLIGGLNYQIEHHLFPNICHMHYRKISHIVAQTAKDYGIPYNAQGSFFRAVFNHAKMLKMLGRYQTI